MDLRTSIAAALFALTFLLLALGRVGRRAIPRGAAALVGGLLTALILQVSWRAIDIQVLLLLAGLMVLAGLAEASGLFAGIRRHLVKQRPAVALWLSLLLVALTSALLLNDAAVVVLVPFLLPALMAVGLRPVPSVVLMAVAANIGSLATPFGNPQNAVLARAAGLGVVEFLQVQGPIALLGLVLLGAASLWVARQRSDLRVEVPAHATARGRPWLVFCIVAFLAGAAVAPQVGVGLGTVAALAALLAYAGARVNLGKAAHGAAWRGLDWNVLALFVGLYLLTGGLRQWVPPAAIPREALASALPAGLLTAVLSNLVGNVPAILTLLRLEPAWVVQHAPFLVTVSTLGGALLLTGSAASLLAADQARKSGVEVRFVPFLREAVPWVLPLLVFGAWVTWRLSAGA
jgi:Na+/H+ antiporter NhaD/arsenite permease-like protein